MNKKNNQMVEIWSDVVDVKHLIISILVCSITTMGAYFLADPTDKTMGLFFGLGGAVLGFLICTFMFKPKRVIVIKEED